MPGDRDVVGLHLAELRLRGYSAGTVYARRRALIRMEMVTGPLLEAGTGDLERWRDQLRVIDNTVVHYASHARAFYAWAVRRGLLERSPAEDLAVPVLVRGLPRPIGELELMAAVAAAGQPVRAWLVLAGWAGLRAKEIALLRREHLLETADPPVVRIVPEATKGRRGRIVPLSEFVLGELAAAGLPRAGYLFRRRDGRPGPNTPATVSHVANRHLAELGTGATLHQLRHRFGTQAYRARRDLRLVQELLGHADPATTAGYAAYCQADAVDVVQALPVPPLLRAVGD